MVEAEFCSRRQISLQIPGQKKFMARPRKGVTFDNAEYIYSHLRSAQQELRLKDLLQQPEKLQQAVDTFAEIPEVGYCLLTDATDEKLSAGRIGVDPYALDLWVVKYISPTGWQRILSAFRQYRHARRHVKTSLKLDQDVYWRFSHFARTQDLSLDQTLTLLLDSYNNSSESF